MTYQKVIGLKEDLSGAALAPAKNEKKEATKAMGSASNAAAGDAEAAEAGEEDNSDEDESDDDEEGEGDEEKKKRLQKAPSDPVARKVRVFIVAFTRHDVFGRSGRRR